MPSGPQPCWRESSCTSHSVSDPRVDTLMVFPLRSPAEWIGPFLSTTSVRSSGASAMRGHSQHRRALHDEGELRTGAQAHVDAVRGERLLQLGAAAKIVFLDFDSMLFENAGLDPDIERREGERLADGFADAHFAGACANPPKAKIAITDNQGNTPDEHSYPSSLA